MNLIALDILVKIAEDSEEKIKNTSDLKLKAFYQDVYDNALDILDTLNYIIINDNE